MKSLFAVLMMSFSLVAHAAEPEIVITTKNAYNGFGTVAGRVVSDGKEAIGVSLDNGGIRYSTIADPSGTWAIVFRHVAVNFVVKAWKMGEPGRTASAEDKLPLEVVERGLPWTQTVSATESSSSESSAKYLTQTSLRWRIDQQKYRCDRDKGRFDYYTWQPTCNKSGHTYRCTGTATCHCRATREEEAGE
jgi:hypothetical protein